MTGVSWSNHSDPSLRVVTRLTTRPTPQRYRPAVQPDTLALDLIHRRHMRIEALCGPRIEPTLLERLVEERAELSAGRGWVWYLDRWVELAIDYGRQWLSLEWRIHHLALTCGTSVVAIRPPLP